MNRRSFLRFLGLAVPARAAATSALALPSQAVYPDMGFGLTVPKIAKALQATAGLTFAAAIYLGVPVEAVDAYVAHYPELQRIVTEERKRVQDTLEKLLMNRGIKPVRA